jgi:glycosyltransferase involved in cell wall biosynthesis
LTAKKIYYWSPHIDHVATIRAVLNSATSLIQFGNNKYDVRIINANGEWNNFKSGDVNFIDLFNKINLKTFPINGFVKSRLSYLYIFIRYFFSLKRLIKHEKPDYLIIHLITSLPLVLLILFNFETRFILRVSGLPKLNFIRRWLWKIASKKLYLITTPTKTTLNYLTDINFIDKKKIILLTDPVYRIREIVNLKKEKFNESFELDKKYIISIGRLTYQKNFNLLIESFFEINKIYNNYKLIIIGDGEKRKELELLISKLNLKNEVFLIGFKKNIFPYLNIADCLISSSRWEDPGFTLIEAGILNKIIISSDCMSGPRELLNDDNGYLFDNENRHSLIHQFVNYKKNSYENNQIKKIVTKNKFKQYSIYSHFLQIKNLLK